MPNKILRMATHVCGDWDESYVASVELTPEFKALVWGRHEKRVQAQSGDLYQLTYWDCNADYRKYDGDEREDESSWWLTETAPAGDPERTEIDLMHFGDRGVHWSMCLKHTDLTVETSEVPYEAFDG